MKSKLIGGVALAIACVAVVAGSARSGQERRPPIRRAKLPGAANANTPVKPLGAILVPGNPLRFDISWVDQATGRYYLAEGGNAAVDVFDARNNLYLGRIGGFHGVGTADDPCGAIEGMGPSGIVVTPSEQLWADDAHGTVKVFDLAGAQPPFNLTPVATISTGAACRADEIGYDPQDKVIVVGNPAEKPPYATVISATAPYEVLSKIPFADARGLEQPLWDPGLKGGRMLVTVPATDGKGGVAVLNLKDPKNPVVEATYPTPNCASGLALGPAQHLLVGCGGGKPLIILNALDGKMITTVEGTHGADEVWYNAGDNRFYAASGGAMPLLAAINAQTGVLVNNAPAGPGVHSVTAYEGNNHVFVPVGVPAANSPGDACSALFGLTAKQGCIAVYAHDDAPGK